MAAVVPSPLDQISSIWREVIWRDTIIDGVGLDSPVLATALRKCKKPWPGGYSATEGYTYKYTNVQATSMGASYTYTDDQFVSSARDRLGEYHAELADFQENLDVFYQGGGWKFNNMNLKAEQAMRSMYAAIGVAIYKDGQSITPVGGSTADNRTLETNGADEAMNDGVTPGWQGKIFPIYREVDRSTVQAGISKKSTPVYLNQQGSSTCNPGPLTFTAMAEREADVNVNGKQFDLCTTTRHGLALAKEVMAQRQVVIETASPYFGVKGVQFGTGMIVADEVAPSAKYGNQIIIPNQSYLTTSFTCPASMPVTSGLSDKSGKTIVIGETMFFWNTDTWTLFMPTAPQFAFGITEFRRMPLQPTMLVADIFAMLTWICSSNRNNGAIYGFGDTF